MKRDVEERQSAGRKTKWREGVDKTANAEGVVHRSMGGEKKQIGRGKKEKWKKRGLKASPFLLPYPHFT